jgi:hypothetical protein
LAGLPGRSPRLCGRQGDDYRPLDFDAGGLLPLPSVVPKERCDEGRGTEVALRKHGDNVSAVLEETDGFDLAMPVHKRRVRLVFRPEQATAQSLGSSVEGALGSSRCAGRYSNVICFFVRLRGCKKMAT